MILDKCDFIFVNEQTREKLNSKEHRLLYEHDEYYIIIILKIN